MKKQIMSIAAIAALFTTGAMAFDMEKDGTIIADVTASTYKSAKYTEGENATAPLQLSPTRQGSALIYPAFKGSQGWSTEISLRNTKDVAIIAKAVLYAQDDSRELLDFNLYLSPHDVAKFTITDNNVTSTDGSIAYQVSYPSAGVSKDSVKFATEKTPFEAPFSSKSAAGYVIIYAMMEQKVVDKDNVTKAEANIYHEDHKKLFQDYRKTIDVCRSNKIGDWREVFKISYPLKSDVLNGTSVSTVHPLLAPNQKAAKCASDSTKFTGKEARHAVFTSPSADSLFGEVSISHKGDKRSLLLPATALSNYVEADKVMLWAEGEYAAIQDRRIDGNKYDTAGILADAATFGIKATYFTFDSNMADNPDEKNQATLLITQPMKRALQMAGKGGAFWRDPALKTHNEWGDFKFNRVPWTDDEGTYKEKTDDTTLFGSLNSPLDGEDAPKIPGGYHSELITLKYETLVKGFESVFSNGTKAGYIDLKPKTYDSVDGDDKFITNLPAIVTEMTSTDVDGEAQINWIYSATN